MSLLHQIGLSFESYGQRLFSPVRNFPLSLLFARDDDIPGLLADGVCDYGIVGRNVLDEQAATLRTLMTETGAPCWLPDAPSEGPCPVE